MFPAAARKPTSLLFLLSFLLRLCGTGGNQRKVCLRNFCRQLCKKLHELLYYEDSLPRLLGTWKAGDCHFVALFQKISMKV